MKLTELYPPLSNGPPQPEVREEDYQITPLPSGERGGVRGKILSTVFLI